MPLLIALVTGTVSVTVRASLLPLTTPLVVNENTASQLMLQSSNPAVPADAVYITRLPAGLLWQVGSSSSSALTAAQLPVLLTSGASGTVMYQPPARKVGVAADSLGFQLGRGGSGYLSATGIVNITILPFKYAPVALNSSLVAFAELPITLAFSGSDPLDFVAWNGTAVITALPANGRLFQTVDGVTPGPQITAAMLPANVSACLFVVGRLL